MEDNYCPDCGSLIDPGSQCDCEYCFLCGEIMEIYSKHKGDAFMMMVDSFNLGFTKGQKSALASQPTIAECKSL